MYKCFKCTLNQTLDFFVDFHPVLKVQDPLIKVIITSPENTWRVGWFKIKDLIGVKIQIN